MFLSLKKHWEDTRTDCSRPLLDLAHVALRTLRTYPIKGDEAELLRFQTDMEALDEQLGDAPDARTVFMTAGSLARAIEDYAHHTNRFLQVHTAELQTMIGMLTSTIATIASASETSVAHLTRVEKRIEKAARAAELPLLKEELSDCLAMVREETARQREETARLIQTLQSSLQRTQSRIREVSAPLPLPAEPERIERDTTTHLPIRADAEETMALARMRPHTFIALLPVDRFQLIRNRFGETAAGEVMAFFARHLRHHLQADDRLFRWSHNALLIVLERELPRDTVRADLSRFASQKLEFTLQHHGREILLPISSSWVLFPASEGRSHESLVRKLDAFLEDEMHVKDSFA